MSHQSLKILLCGHHAKLLASLQKNAVYHRGAEILPANAPFSIDANFQHIGLVFVLHNPPAYDGMPALREWRRQAPDTSVVVATSDTSFHTTNQIWRAGARDVLPLPSSDEQVLSCLEAHCAGFRLAAAPAPSKGRGKAWRAMLTAAAPGLVAAPLEALPPGATNALPLNPHIEMPEKMFRGLEVSFFGEFKASLFGKPIVLTKQAEQLFAYLIYHHGARALTREHLGKVFWPDKYDISPEGARRSLNVEMAKIRKTLRGLTGIDREFVAHQNQRYQLEETLYVESDLDRFKTILSAVKKAVWEGREVSNELFREALLIYRGNFMENCAVESHNWIEIERHRLGNDFLELALCYGEQLFRQGDYGKTAAVCRDILARDHCLEVIHRRLMECYCRQGMCDKAIEQYRHCCLMMEHEFQSKPSPETNRLYDQIRRECAEEKSEAA